MKIQRTAISLILVLSLFVSACSIGAEVGLDGGNGSLDTGLGDGDSGGSSGSQNSVSLDNPLVIIGIVLLVILGLLFGLRNRRNIDR